MKKIVVNRCFGGFGLSDEAMVLYAHLTGLVLVRVKGSFGGNDYYVDEVGSNNYFYDRDIVRDDAALVTVVETLGERASAKYARLAVVEIPEDVEWEIAEYDGAELIAERHRTWR